MNAKIRAYVGALPPATRKEFKKLQAAIVAAAPEAEEHFSYGIPGYRLDGKTLVWCAAWKNHFSMYPMTAAIKTRCAADLEGYKVAKGTVQFAFADPVPVGLVKKIVKARAAEIRKK